MLDVLSAAFSQPALLGAMIAAYFLGSIPFGYLLARRLTQQDVRVLGSGNIGATNVARVVGKKLGLLTLLLDAAKGALPILALRYLPASPAYFSLEYLPASEAILGVCAFLGHCFPVWLRFRGGKGVATGIGVLLAHVPVVALLGIAGFATLFLLTRTVSLSSLAGAVVALVAYGVTQPWQAAALPLLFMLVVLMLRHTSNIRRLLRHQELSL